MRAEPAGTRFFVDEGLRLDVVEELDRGLGLEVELIGLVDL